MIRTLDEHVRSGVCRLTPLSHDVVESEIELIEGQHLQRGCRDR